MDPEIDELKEIVKRQGKVIEETNELVRGMRRSQRWHMIVRMLWWFVILGGAAWGYYTFVQPYVEQLFDAYGNAKDFQIQIQNFFAQFGRTNQ